MKQKLKKFLTHLRDIVIKPKRYFTKIVADGGDCTRAGGDIAVCDGRSDDAGIGNYRWRTRLGNRNQGVVVDILYVSGDFGVERIGV